MKRLLIGVLGAAVLVGGAALAVHNQQLGTLRAVVLEQLADPSAAQFRVESYQGSWLWPRGLYCGEVNAKNQFGAYLGFRKFSVLNDDLLLSGLNGLEDADIEVACPDAS